MATYTSSTAAFSALLRVMERGLGGDDALKKIADTTFDNVLARHGVYPSDANWPRLKPGTIASKGADTPRQETGAHSGNHNKSISGDEASVGTDDVIELYQEFGTSKIPPRPIYGPEFNRAKGDYVPDIVKAEAAKNLSSL